MGERFLGGGWLRHSTSCPSFRANRLKLLSFYSGALAKNARLSLGPSELTLHGANLFQERRVHSAPVVLGHPEIVALKSAQSS